MPQEVAVNVWVSFAFKRPSECSVNRHRAIQPVFQGHAGGFAEQKSGAKTTARISVGNGRGLRGLRGIRCFLGKAAAATSDTNAVPISLYFIGCPGLWAVTDKRSACQRARVRKVL
jgi:hypothetical protein